MKIKVNKEKLKAAIEKRLDEKKKQYSKELSDWERKKKQHDAELIAFLNKKIKQIENGEYENVNEYAMYYSSVPSAFGNYNHPNQFFNGCSLPSLPYKPKELCNRDEDRLLAQLDIMEEPSIEIDDHSDYFRYI